MDSTCLGLSPYFLASLPQEPIRDRCQGHGAVRTLIYPYAVPAVLSVCQNQRTPKVMHKSWSLTRHINDVFQLCTDLTDLYSHAFAPENLSCISLSIVHRHPHMPETAKSTFSIETQQVGGPQRSRDQGVIISATPGRIQEPV